MSSSRTPAAISVCAERRAAFPIERLASAGTGLSANPPLVTSRVPPPAARRTGAATCAATTAPRTSTSWAVRSRSTVVSRISPGSGRAALYTTTSGAPRGAEDPFERLAVAVQILDIRTDRLYLKAPAPQFRGELVERFAAGDQLLRKPSRPKRRTTPAPTPGPAPISRR
jgi:hypothetical protein